MKFSNTIVILALLAILSGLFLAEAEEKILATFQFDNAKALLKIDKVDQRIEFYFGNVNDDTRIADTSHFLSDLKPLLCRMEFTPSELILRTLDKKGKESEYSMGQPDKQAYTILHYICTQLGSHILSVGKDNTPLDTALIQEIKLIHNPIIKPDPPDPIIKPKPSEPIIVCDTIHLLVLFSMPYRPEERLRLQSISCFQASYRRYATLSQEELEKEQRQWYERLVGFPDAAIVVLWMRDSSLRKTLEDSELLAIKYSLSPEEIEQLKSIAQMPEILRWREKDDLQLRRIIAEEAKRFK